MSLEGVIAMEESILKSIQERLGPDLSYDVFTPDILVGINSAISVLTQLGVGPEDGFRITGTEETWSDLIGDAKYLDMVKDYVYLKTKLVFDPPSNSSLVTFYKQECNELEWRINVAVDPKKH